MLLSKRPFSLPATPEQDTGASQPVVTVTGTALKTRGHLEEMAELLGACPDEL